MTMLIGRLLVCAIWAVTAAVLIAQDLDKRGVPVRFVWLRRSWPYPEPGRRKGIVSKGPATCAGPLLRITNSKP
jgi:hypothetical protein